MAKLNRIFALAALMALMALPAVSSAGTVTRTLGRYSAGGAGLGALLGAGGATVSYINTGRSFDFVTGAGLGILVGAGVGYLFGILDLAGGEPEEEADPKEGINPEKTGLRLLPMGTMLGLSPSGPSVSFQFRF